jgi:hypothetical protein
MFSPQGRVEIQNQEITKTGFAVIVNTIHVYRDEIK